MLWSASQMGSQRILKVSPLALPILNESITAVSDSATAIEAGGVSNGTSGTNPTGNVTSNDTDIDIGDTKTVTGVVAGVAANAVANVGTVLVETSDRSPSQPMVLTPTL